MNEQPRNRASLFGAFSIWAAFTLLTIKLVAGFWTKSYSVFAVAIDSATDVLAAVFNFLALKYSAKPADDNHPYGHGKAEDLASFGQGIFILLSCFFTGAISIYRFFETKQENASLGSAFSVLVATFFLSSLTFFILRHGAKQCNSRVLAIDAFHYLNDLLFTGLGLLALGLGLFFQIWWFDVVGGILICLLVGWQSARIVRDSLHALMDHNLNESEIDIVEQEISRISSQGVLEVHALRSRRSGGHRFIDAHVVLCEKLSLRDAHELVELLQHRISQRFHGAEVMLHTDPCQDVEEGHNPCNYRRSCPIRSNIDLPDRN